MSVQPCRMCVGSSIVCPTATCAQHRGFSSKSQLCTPSQVLWLHEYLATFCRRVDNLAQWRHGCARGCPVELTAFVGVHLRQECDPSYRHLRLRRTSVRLKVSACSGFDALSLPAQMLSSHSGVVVFSFNAPAKLKARLAWPGSVVGLCRVVSTPQRTKVEHPSLSWQKLDRR